MSQPLQQDALSSDVARLLLQEFQLQQTKLDMMNAELHRTQGELELARARYYDFYNIAPIGFLTLTSGGVVIEANHAMSHVMLKSTGAVLLDKLFIQFIHSEDQAIFAHQQQQLFQNGLTAACEVRLIDGKTPEQTWVRIEAVLTQDSESQNASKVIVIDISERKKNEMEQKRHSAVLIAMKEIAEAAIFTNSLTDFYQAVRTIIRRLSPAENFLIAIFDQEQQEVFYPYHETKNKKFPSRRPVGKGLTEYVMKMGRTLFLTAEDLQRLKALGEDQVSYVEVNSWLGSPLIDPQGKIFGAIALFSSQRAKSEQTLSIEVFSAISAQISQAIQRKKAESAIVDNEIRLRTLLATIPDLVWLKDPDGLYLFCNPTFERFFGSKEAGIIGKTDYDFVDKQLADFFRDRDCKAIAAGVPSINEECVTFADDGHVAFLETIKTPIYDSAGFCSGVLGISRDISEHKKMLIELQKQAITDDLTGLFNRRHFVCCAEQELKRIKRYGGSCCLLLLDLDSFKNINDVYGHPTGDLVLCEIAGVFRSGLRCTDLIGRIGGEEFAILLQETDLSGASLVAERICRDIEAAKIEAGAGMEVKLTVSIGVVEHESPSEKLTELMCRADQALYAAKDGGRNRVFCA